MNIEQQLQKQIDDIIADARERIAPLAARLIELRRLAPMEPVRVCIICGAWAGCMTGMRISRIIWSVMMTNKAEAFKAANAASPVVGGTNTGDGGNIYTLQNGAVWHLNREECEQTGMPRWLEPPVSTPLTAEQLQAEHHTFIAELKRRTVEFQKWVEADTDRLRALTEASSVPKSLQVAMLMAMVAQMDQIHRSV